MAFDQSTRNRLQRLVSDARALLTQEFTRQVQHEYGMDPATGEVAAVDKLSHMDDTHRETARLLRDTLNHYRATSPSGGNKATLERIVREQAFTVASFTRSQGLKPLRETYATKEDLLRHVPRLIIEHNIHGIDIDSRAVQIAGLSLWLRAQRSWQRPGYGHGGDRGVLSGSGAIRGSRHGGR